ncbi:PH domain-containing protein [Streptomyces sp. NBC_00140]|uniref:PH domain-containing protein n=1 Tax=Streptomyces sp. NBC_00140 TaxID=2975664 RepID=UPI0022586F3B|nr:PH domain-containing protein [Streptomyces sp. NBC_00140]MCX5331771.1 PH domain-containing protein [Streptomyces sp. NBC_00140]
MTTKDRIYRSPAGIAGGALLLAIVLWLGIDALVQGEDRTPWLALASMILAVPLIVAFTVRPAVYANEDRLRIRNPFRVIVLPWGQAASLRSGYSNEVVAESGDKFQLWAVPVSLRARKRAARKDARAERGGGAGLRLGFGGGGAAPAPAPDAGPARAETDKIMDDLREFMETRGTAASAQGEVTVRWAYEIFAPVVAGAVLLVILIATG